MKMQAIKDRVYDYKTATRWATLHAAQRRNKVTGQLNPEQRLRVVGIGRKYIRLMYADGKMKKFLPEAISIAF